MINCNHDELKCEIIPTGFRFLWSFRLNLVCLYSLYVKHHVRNGLLFVLLVVVEENLLAANYHILDTQQTPLYINRKFAFFIKAICYIKYISSHV